MTSLTLRNVEVEGVRGLDLHIKDGRIRDLGVGLPADREELDGQGGVVIPGLCDHHIHLLALAAHATSVRLDGVSTPKAFAERVERATASRPSGAWIRATGYDEAMAGDLTRESLDRLAPRHRLRVQHRTGSLWMLNTLALLALDDGDDPPELDRASGRLWRGDAWLRDRMGSAPPALEPIGRQLAAYGLTAVTDASVTTDAAAAGVLGDAVRSGALRQHLTLMSGGELTPPRDSAFEIGPLKVLLDDHRLPDPDEFAAFIRQARQSCRSVAVHCVTAGELAITLAAFAAAGAQRGDRIEHGGMIAAAAIGPIRSLGLTIVTQPAFIHDRGDRYAATIAEEDFDDLYRCGSLMAAGIPVAASSDAPYASVDPWLAVATAARRLTARGLRLGAEERLSPRAALGLYLGESKDPGGAERRLAPGATADLCLLEGSLADVLDAPDARRVQATIVGGRTTYLANP